MSRMQRVRDAISSTVSKLRSEIEGSQKSGKIPQDYSLGFINAMIFVEHQIEMRLGRPVFYDRTTAIGKLPKPVVLATGNVIQDSATHQFMLDVILLQARIVAKDENPTPDIVALHRAIKSLDEWVNDTKEMIRENEEAEKIEQESNAGARPSEGLHEVPGCERNEVGQSHARAPNP